MTEDDVFAKLNDIFKEVFEDDGIVLTPDTTAQDIEDWDSLTNVELLVAIEKSFGNFRFSTGEIANLKNVGELAKLIVNKTA